MKNIYPYMIFQKTHGERFTLWNFVFQKKPHCTFHIVHKISVNTKCKRRDFAMFISPEVLEGKFISSKSKREAS